jgi:hypothetical protein
VSLLVPVYVQVYFSLSLLVVFVFDPKVKPVELPKGEGVVLPPPKLILPEPKENAPA